jgi:hypothetical protein
VDDGVTSRLAGHRPRRHRRPGLTYNAAYSNDQGTDPFDALIVQVSSDGGNSWSELTDPVSTGGWRPGSPLAQFTSVTARMRFQPSSRSARRPSVVEAAIDDSDITGPSAGCAGCPAVSPVGTIFLHRSGDDVVLSWDVDPASAPRYVVYRVAEPASTSRSDDRRRRELAHEGAAGTAGLLLVSAVNACGQESAID